MSASGVVTYPSPDVILGVVWHDPPWKPWAIRARFRGGQMARLTTTRYPSGSTLPTEKDLLSRIKERVRNLELLGDRREHAVGLLEKAYTEMQSKERAIKAHERQALLIPATVYAILHALDLVDEAKIAFEAGMRIAEDDPRIRCADTLASALDRYVILEIARSIGYEIIGGAREFIIINPFNPAKKLSIPYELPAEKIAEFVVNYATAIAIALKNAEGNKVQVLRDLAALLLEPIWYASVGDEYIPPADTRVPSHTVFDHVNAALATLLWCPQNPKGEVRPEGYLVVVNLAGVQAWIRESRRLRDLWASSWLASLLAWKAVEDFVESHGIGVLVQPPARLHSFLAAKILGAINKSLKFKINNEIELGLHELLGLPLGWPVDPTIPNKILIALPRAAGSKADIVERISQGVEEAWKTILREVLNRFKEEIEDLCASQAPDSCSNIIPARGENWESIKNDLAGLLEVVEQLEPPLLARIRVVDVGGVYNKISERTKKDKINLTINLAPALYFHAAIAEAFRRNDKGGVKAPGRRLGGAYYEYATKLYERGWSGKLCTVCGKSPAIIDGGALAGKAPLIIKRLAGEVGDDRLCPYCLVKRLLRSELQRDLAPKIVGLKLSREAADKLKFASIIAFTSRTRLGLEAIHGLAELLCMNWDRLEDAIIQDVDLVKAMLARNTAPGLETPPSECSAEEKLDAWAYSVSLSLEAAHDDNILSDLVGALRNSDLRDLAKKVESIASELARYRTKYTIVAMDADYAGLVSQGKLEVDAESYARAVLNITNESIYRRAVGIYSIMAELAGNETIGDARREEWEGEREGSSPCIAGCSERKHKRLREPPTVILTPSYAFSLSRALAVSAHIDRSIVESRGGMIIYAGGDDVLAVIPPVSESEIEGYSFEALRAVRDSRRAYWGAHEDYKPENSSPQHKYGFNALRLEKGSRRITVGVAPALAAYGKSSAVYAVDSGLPLWLSIETLMALEESKDSAYRRLIKQADEDPGCTIIGPCKDVLLVASDSGGVAVLPWSINTVAALGDGSLIADIVADSVSKLASLSLATSRRRASLSPQAFHEAASLIGLINQVVERGELGLAHALVWRVIERHSESDESAPGYSPEALFKNMLNLLESRTVPWSAYQVVVGAGGRAGELLRMSLGVSESVLIMMLLHAARILRGWL